MLRPICVQVKSQVACLTLVSGLQLHAKFEDSAYAYLCTELCSGGDLERLVEVRAMLLRLHSCS